MTLFLGAAPLGLATGILAWVAAGGASADAERLAPIAQQISSLKAAKPSGGSDSFVSISDLTSTPLFALTVGPGAVADPVIRLDGLALTRNRAAALVSINGAPAQWVSQGESRDGVSIQQVLPTRIVVETVVGTKEVALGERSAGEGGAPAPASQTPLVATTDQIPPGYRSPPPPASAPRGP